VVYFGPSLDVRPDVCTDIAGQHFGAARVTVNRTSNRASLVEPLHFVQCCVSNSILLPCPFEPGWLRFPFVRGIYVVMFEALRANGVFEGPPPEMASKLN